jgi:hypothetical protein
LDREQSSGDLDGRHEQHPFRGSCPGFSSDYPEPSVGGGSRQSELHPCSSFASTRIIPLVELDEMAGALAATLVAPQASRPPSWRWSDATPKDRITISCDNCNRRIAWWTTELRSGWLVLQDVTHRGWKWQGECPIRFRGQLVDATCPSCHRARFGVARQLSDWWTAPPEML